MPALDIDKLPQKPAPETSKQAERAGKTPGNYFLFVDYDLIYADPADPYKIYGNWRNTAYEACQDKTVDSYVNRND